MCRDPQPDGLFHNSSDETTFLAAHIFDRLMESEAWRLARRTSPPFREWGATNNVQLWFSFMRVVAEVGRWGAWSGVLGVVVLWSAALQGGASWGSARTCSVRPRAGAGRHMPLCCRVRRLFGRGWQCGVCLFSVWAGRGGV